MVEMVKGTPIGVGTVDEFFLFGGQVGVVDVHLVAPAAIQLWVTPQIGKYLQHRVDGGGGQIATVEDAAAVEVVHQYAAQHNDGGLKA